MVKYHFKIVLHIAQNTFEKRSLTASLFLFYLKIKGVFTMKNTMITKDTSFKYIQLPTFLFDEQYSNFNCTDRMLYAVLLDRYRLSLQNNIVDEEGNNYITYLRTDLCGVLGCTEPTLRKSIKNLVLAGLIKDISFKKKYIPNKIYLFMPESSIMGKGCSDEIIEETAEVISPCNTENCATNSTFEQEIKEQIEYDKLAQDKCTQNHLDNIVKVMSMVFTTKKESLRINGKAISTKTISEKLKQLKASNICYVCDCLNKTKSVIKFMKAYLLTSLFNATQINTQNKKTCKTQQSHSFDVSIYEQLAVNCSTHTITHDNEKSYDIERIDELAINLHPNRYSARFAY
jgi:hypothetical protein